MGRLKVLAIASVAALIALAAIGCGGSGGDESTLVFGTASDQTALDGALISDGESIRVLYQMTEGLTALQPGTSDVIPSLATDWTTSEDGKAWTFNLRGDVGGFGVASDFVQSTRSGSKFSVLSFHTQRPHS